MNQPASGQPLWNFSGHCVALSGGARGIGAGIVRLFARSGATVLFGDVDAVGSEQLIRELGHDGERVHFVEADFSKADAWPQMLIAAAERELQPNLVVANVGVTVQQPLEAISADDYEWILNSNLRSAWLAGQTFAPTLRRQTGSSLVLIGSVMARFGTPNCALYATTKAALSGLLKSFCVELASAGTRVNMVVPGYIVNDPPGFYRQHIPSGLWRAFHEEFAQQFTQANPPVQPLATWGVPEDIAQAVAFLHSPAARYITGIELPVDGGLLCQTPIRPGTGNESWGWTPEMLEWLTARGIRIESQSSAP